MKTILAFAALCLTVLVSGCGETPRKTLSAPVTPAAKERIVTELQPESSPEVSIRKYYNEADELVRVETNFRDKSVGGESYFPDGKVKERWRTYDNSSQVKERTTFQNDGKTVETSLSYHRNGKVWKDLRLQKDGAYRVTQYWESGIIMSDLLVRVDGTAERLSYSEDGKYVDRKTIVHASGELESWDYNAKGGVTARSHWSKKGDQTVEYFREDGKVSHRQWWRILRNFDTTRERSHRGWVLEKVEEYAADGKTTTRRIVLADGPRDVNAISQVEILAANGERTVRTLVDGENVSREEQYNAKGDLVSSTDYQDDERPVETVDKKLLECWFVIGHKFDNYD